MRDLDPTIPFANATVMTDRVELSMAPQLFRSLVPATLASMALLLATLGGVEPRLVPVGREEAASGAGGGGQGRP